MIGMLLSMSWEHYIAFFGKTDQVKTQQLLAGDDTAQQATNLVIKTQNEIFEAVWLPG